MWLITTPISGNDTATDGGADGEGSDEGSQSDEVEELSEAGLTVDLVAEIERTVGPTGENICIS